MFTAVRTTGIYCRPGCPATPMPQNKAAYPTAAAAEAAGFRPCRRCRPYRTAPPRPDGSDLVCRAVALILDGCLDEGAESDLAERLGVSARQLRRRCLTEIGVTPTDLARSVRAHFARRLLDDTDLPITELAYAAGYSDIRQFNREMRRVFHGAPRDLRARRHRTDRLVADGGLATRLPYDGPLDWDRLLDHVRPIPGIETVDSTNLRYRRTIEVRGAPGLLELAPGEPGNLHLTLHLPHWEELAHLVRRARWIVGLDDSPDQRPAQIRPWSRVEHELSDLNGPGDQQQHLARWVDERATAVPGLDSYGLSHVLPDGDTRPIALITVEG